MRHHQTRRSEVHDKLPTAKLDTYTLPLFMVDNAHHLSDDDLRVRNRAIEAINVGIAITDAHEPDMPIVFCNEAFQSITGYSAEEVLGRNCRFLQRDDRNQDARRLIREAVNKGRECRALLRNYRKDGSMFWNDLTLSPVRDLSGAVTHYVGLINDVTARVVAEEQKREREARLQAILDTAVEAIITIDEQGRCESLNGAAEQMFGYRADEVVGQNISMLMPEPYCSEHDGYIREYLKTGKKKIIGIGREAIGLRKSGEEFPIHLSVSEIRLDRGRLFTGIVHDLTEQKDAQQRLVQSERLAVLGEAMARLAHESRNALQRIQIAVESARSHCDDNSPQAKHLDAIERANDALNALLEELRNYAAPLHLEKKTTSLATVWREAWGAVAHHRSDRVVEFVESGETEECKCSIDRFRIGQVFRNLFENSLAACTDPARIDINVSECPVGDQSGCRVAIRDNGPGLDADQARRVFEPFFTTKAKGTGLGMAIAKRIVEAHGGTIELSAGTQPGAEFVIVLPA